MGKTKTQFVGEEISDKNQAKKKVKSDKVHLTGQKGGERIKLVEGAINKTVEKAESTETKRAGKPRVRGKKYLEAKAKIDRNKLYPIKDAINLVRETSVSKFDGTIELHMVIKKQGATFTLTLPHPTGKTKKVEIADEETIKKLQKGKIDFDVLLATADMMPKLVPFARLLGPRGLMPNPKNGTLLKSAKDAEKFNASKITLKTEKAAPVIHTTIGKVSMKEEELSQNMEAVLGAVNKRQIVKAYLSSSMGPSVKVQISQA